jgi:predicted alpha/beta hydrolase family esterase
MPAQNGQTMNDPRVLLLPGWQNSGPEHWQTRWEAARRHPRRAARLALAARGDWMAQLDEVLLQDDAPALLVAVLGCQLVASGPSTQHRRVKGALLVARPTPSARTCRRNCTTGGRYAAPPPSQPGGDQQRRPSAPPSAAC